METIDGVLVMCGSAREAELIGRALVEERLTACANRLGPVESIFWWDGQVQQEDEVLLVWKTTRDLVGELTERVTEMHGYEVPEVVAFPIVSGLEAYLEWVREETRSPGEQG